MSSYIKFSLYRAAQDKVKNPVKKQVELNPCAKNENGLDIK